MNRRTVAVLAALSVATAIAPVVATAPSSATPVSASVVQVAPSPVTQKQLLAVSPDQQVVGSSYTIAHRLQYVVYNPPLKSQGDTQPGERGIPWGPRANPWSKRIKVHVYNNLVKTHFATSQVFGNVTLRNNHGHGIATNYWDEWVSLCNASPGTNCNADNLIDNCNGNPVTSRKPPGYIYRSKVCELTDGSHRYHTAAINFEFHPVRRYGNANTICRIYFPVAHRTDTGWRFMAAKWLGGTYGKNSDTQHHAYCYLSLLKFDNMPKR